MLKVKGKVPNEDYLSHESSEPRATRSQQRTVVRKVSAKRSRIPDDDDDFMTPPVRKVSSPVRKKASKAAADVKANAKVYIHLFCPVFSKFSYL